MSVKLVLAAAKTPRSICRVRVEVLRSREESGRNRWQIAGYFLAAALDVSAGPRRTIGSPVRSKCSAILAEGQRGRGAEGQRA